MNRYAAVGILVDAMDGKQIVVVERSGHEVQAAVRTFREVIELHKTPADVRVANGAERISLPGGGWIRFATPQSQRLRGLSADVVFIDNDAHRVLPPYRQAMFWQDVVRPTLVARQGEVIHS